MKIILKKLQELSSKINAGAVAVALLTFIIGWQLGYKDATIKSSGDSLRSSITNTSSPKNISVDFKLFWDTWDLLGRSYLDKKAIDPQKMFYGAEIACEVREYRPS